MFLRSAIASLACCCLALRTNRGGLKSSTGAVDIRIAGYASETSSYSKGLDIIGDRVKARFGDAVDVSIVHNVLDQGSTLGEMLQHVHDGDITLAYISSSYLENAPAIRMADLPFMFEDATAARAAFDGDFGNFLAGEVAKGYNFDVLGWYENGLFRHLSNRLRTVRMPEDLQNMSVRVMPSPTMARTFELLGATPVAIPISEALERIAAGTLDGQENPLANTVAFGIQDYHEFNTLSGHFYTTRPIIANRAALQSWSPELQAEVRAAVTEAVNFQRGMALTEHEEARKVMEGAGCEVTELTENELARWKELTAPVYEELEAQLGADLLSQLPR